MPENFHKQKSMRLAEMRELMRRIYTQRNRFRGVFPENLRALIEQAKQDGKKEGSGSFNQIYACYSLGNTLYRRKEPIAMGELSHILDVPFSTATHLVDGFVKNGFAQRSDDPDDRRVVRVGLTDSGCQLMETINDFVSQRIIRIINIYTEEEQEQIIALLRKLVTVMEKES
jgi:DNA-binding MarR family transcriptional regulator